MEKYVGKREFYSVVTAVCSVTAIGFCSENKFIWGWVLIAMSISSLVKGIKHRKNKDNGA